MGALASDWLRHFRLLLWNRWTEFNETWQRSKISKPSYQVCVFRADRKNKMAALASDWPRHFRLLLWNRWTEFSESWQKARSQRSLPSLFFFRADRKNKMAAWPPNWLRYFRLLLLKRWMEFNETWQEARSKRPLQGLCFLGRSEKTRWPPWPLIGWDIFDFSSETAEPNSMKLDRKQDLNALYQVCVFWADLKNKMAALASDWLKHFRLLCRNRWTEFSGNLTGSKLSMPFYHVCVFQANREKTKWPPWPLIGWDIFDFSSETVKGIRRNLIGSKISNALYQVCVFSGGSEKQKWPPWPWPMICWDIFNFSSETAE